MTGDEIRGNAVSEKLSTDLHKFLINYRAKDGKVLTEGEVMTAIGRIIARKSSTDQRVAQWLAAISAAAASVYVQMKERKE